MRDLARADRHDDRRQAGSDVNEARGVCFVPCRRGGRRPWREEREGCLQIGVRYYRTVTVNHVTRMNGERGTVECFSTGQRIHWEKIETSTDR
jgi:hypothetical protein